MKTQTTFREYDPDQLLLLPPDMNEWLPDGHLVYFIRDIAAQLDLSALYKSYDGSKGGHPPYHPELMVALLLYAYCVGEPSSRKIERATYESVPFRVLAADQHPDHDTIAAFRHRHLEALAGLFVQVLRLCRKAGLVKLGHVALDGTKVRANASKHKAMSYQRMEKSVAELEAEVRGLLAAAAAVDTEEDARFGKGHRGEDLPEELRFKQSRLARIREAKEALEREAREQAEEKRRTVETKDPDDPPRRGRPPKAPSKTPAPKAQRNFTDPDSRIMKDGATKSFEQSYNAQAAVDGGGFQIILAAGLTQAPNDKQQLQPLIEQAKGNMDGMMPKRVSADSGYYSQDNVTYLVTQHIDGYVATGRITHPEAAPRGRIPAAATVKERMARKLRTLRGKEIYGKRKGIVEPVFGQIKQVRGFRRFWLRGVERVRAEWELICLGHNLLKLFKCDWSPKMA